MFSTYANLLVAGVLAAATGDPALNQAVDAYEQGEYTTSSAKLERLLERGMASDSEGRARLYLSASYFALDSRALARSTLEALFAKAPDTKVDPALFPPAFCDFAEEARRELSSRKVDPTPRPEPTLNLRAPEPPPYTLAFIPFGVGQFATQRPAKGLALLGLEVAGLTVAAVGKLSFESLRLPGNEGRFSDPEKAKKLQWTFLGAFWAAVGIAAYGVIDAAWEWPKVQPGPAPATSAAGNP